MVEQRTCGACVVCCFYPSINQEGLKKKALHPCKNLRSSVSLIPDTVKEEGKLKGLPLLSRANYQLPGSTNCKIYSKRPRCCSDYECAWLKGHGNFEDRPDKSGILVDDIASPGPIDNSLVAKPLWLDADTQPAGEEAIENISRDSGVPILVVQFTEFRLLRVVGRGVE